MPNITRYKIEPRAERNRRAWPGCNARKHKIRTAAHNIILGACRIALVDIVAGISERHVSKRDRGMVTIPDRCGKRSPAELDI